MVKGNFSGGKIEGPGASELDSSVLPRTGLAEFATPSQSGLMVTRPHSTSFLKSLLEIRQL
jgi:hypothetical protein